MAVIFPGFRLISGLFIPVAMTKAEQYRKLAEEAAKRAQSVKDSEAMRMYQQLADSWREMAEQAERNGW